MARARVLDANGSVEASGNDTGKFKDAGLNCTDFWTVRVKLEFDGSDIGNGLMFVEDGEIVVYTTSLQEGQELLEEEVCVDQ